VPAEPLARLAMARLTAVQRRRRRGVRRMTALAVILLAWLAWVAGLFAFVHAIPMTVDRPTARTDAIVVLTGGSLRLDTGLRLLAERRGDRLFVSGVHRGVDVVELLRAYEQAPERTRCCLDLGHDAINTVGNATETAEWVARNGYESIRLVTASYHMPRSLMEFSHAMPDVELVAHPVFPEHVRIEKWWRWPGTTALIVREYNKYLVAWTRLAWNKLSG